MHVVAQSEQQVGVPSCSSSHLCVLISCPSKYAMRTSLPLRPYNFNPHILCCVPLASLFPCLRSFGSLIRCTCCPQHSSSSRVVPVVSDVRQAGRLASQPHASWK